MNWCLVRGLLLGGLGTVFLFLVIGWIAAYRERP